LHGRQHAVGSRRLDNTYTPSITAAHWNEDKEMKNMKRRMMRIMILLLIMFAIGHGTPTPRSAIGAVVHAAPTSVPASTTTQDAFFLSRVPAGSKDVDVKIDRAGGRHAAFAEWNGDGVVYGYCANRCGSETNWTFVEIFTSHVEFGREPRQVQLQLDSNDHPRIGFEVDGYSPKSDGFFYAECNTDCTNAARWGTINFAEAGDTIAGASRWFVLDKQGQPRAVTLYAQPNYLFDEYVSLHYHSCTTDCLNQTNWSSVNVQDLGNLGLNPIVITSLGLTTNGYPRIGLYAHWNNSTTSYYFECNAECENDTSWQWVYVPNRLSDWFDLTLDAQDRVRVATRRNNGIQYITCDSDCTDATQWNSVSITDLPAGAGGWIHLVFDSQNRPHMAYTVHPATAGVSLDDLYCTDGCDTLETSKRAGLRTRRSASLPHKASI
jgi:hypothetical protein